MTNPLDWILSVIGLPVKFIVFIFHLPGKLLISILQYLENKIKNFLIFLEKKLKELLNKFLNVLKNILSYPFNLFKWGTVYIVEYSLKWAFGLLSLSILYVTGMGWDLLNIVLTTVPKKVVNALFGIIPNSIPGVSLVKSAVKELINSIFKIKGKNRTKRPDISKALADFSKKAADDAIKAFKKLVGLE